MLRDVTLCCNVPAEVVDEHDAGVRLVHLCVENPAAFRRDRQAIFELFLDIEDLTDLFGGEIEAPDGLRRIGGRVALSPSRKTPSQVIDSSCRISGVSMRGTTASE